MLRKTILLIFTAAFAGQVTAQPAAAPTLMRFRASLHNPLKPTENFFYADKSGAIIPLKLRMKDLSSPELTQLSNDSIVLYDKLAVDPKKPEASVAAVCKVPAGIKRAVFIILPSPAGVKPPYRMVCIEDSFKGFPGGESRILTLIAGEAAVEAGEHKLAIHPGVITRIPPVKKADDFHMAQIKFLYKVAKNWISVDERQSQFLEGYRRIFILHLPPGSDVPSISTIVDTEVPSAQAATP
jgi:hypothetical protein